MTYYSKPTTDQLTKIRVLLISRQRLTTFLNGLENPEWAYALADLGTFDFACQPSEDSFFLPYPACKYLARAAKAGNQDVRDFITNHLLKQGFADSRLFDEVAMICINMDTTNRGKLTSQLCKRIREQKQQIMPYVMLDLLKELISDDNASCVTSLTWALCEVHSPSEEGASPPTAAYERRLHEYCRTDEYGHREVLDMVKSYLTKKNGLKFLRGLCSELNKGLSTAFSDGTYDERYDFFDYSVTGQRNSPSSHLTTLADLVTEVSSHLLAEVGFETLKEELTKYPWAIFKRITLGLVAADPDVSQEALLDYVSLDDLVDPDSCAAERWQVLRSHWAILGALQDALIQAVQSGPDVLKETGRMTRFLGQEPTAKQMEDRLAYWRKDLLSNFLDLLSAEQKEVLSDYIADAEAHRREQDETPSGAVWVGSPKTIEELDAMNDDELLAFLQTWQPEHRWWVDRDGLANVFEELVAKNPGRILNNASAFSSELCGEFRQNLINGLKQAFKDRTLTALEPALVELHTSWLSNEEAPLDSILLRSFLKCYGTAVNEDVPLSADHQRLMVHTIDRALSLDDPYLRAALEVEPGSRMADDLTRSLNCLHGDAVHLAVYLWKWSVRNKVVDFLETEAGRCLKKVLERLVAEKAETASLAPVVAATLFFVQQDQSWYREKLLPMFSMDPADARRFDALFATFVKWLDFTKLGYDELRIQYVYSIEARLGPLPDDARKKLGQHAAIAYIWGIDSGEPTLYELLLQVAAPELVVEVLAQLGNSVSRTELVIPAETLARLRAAWEMAYEALQDSLETVKDNPQFEDLKASIADAFAGWVRCRQFSMEWRIKTLIEVLQASEIVRNSYGVVDALADAEDGDLRQALLAAACLAKYEKYSFGWHSWVEPAKSLIKRGLSSPEAATQRAAEVLQDMLVKVGLAVLAEIKGPLRD